MTFSGVIVPFLIYWLMLFVGCFIVLDYGHYYLYDERPKHGGWKSLGGAFVLAALTVLVRNQVPSLFGGLVLMGIAWFGVFTLLFQFHAWHALGVGLATMVVVTGFAIMAVDSLTAPSTRAPVDAIRRPNKPFRQALPATPGAPPAASPTPDATAPAPNAATPGGE